MKFDGTINIPGLIAAATLAASGVAAWSNSNERHAKTESAVAEQHRQITSIETRLTADRKEFKDDVLRTLEEIKRDVRALQPHNNRRPQ